MKGMIKAVCLLFCMIIFSAAAQASDFSKITTNDKLVSALSKLELAGQSEVISVLNGSNSTGKPIRVMFRDLSIYGQNKSEAVTMKTNNGGMIIFISNKHADSSPEAVACLIAHESVHEAGTNTVEEEIKAWSVEASTWLNLTAQNPSLKSDGTKLTKRLNYIAGLQLQDGSTSISKLIANNGVYKNLQ